MKPNNPLAQNCVFPAKAGIQWIKKSPYKAGQRGFVRFAGFCYLLDSGLPYALSASKHLSLPFKGRVGVRIGLNFMDSTIPHLASPLKGEEQDVLAHRAFTRRTG